MNRESNLGLNSDGDISPDSDEKFGQRVVFDVLAEAALHTPWFNETLTHVNDAVVRLSALDGDFHWQEHEADEFFLVLNGDLVIEIEGGEPLTLRPNNAVTIPRGVLHKPSSTTRTVILMVEPPTLVPTGD